MVVTRAVGKSLFAALKKVQEDLESVKKEFLTEVAKDLVELSPVDTGDYIMSHKISDTSLAGRFTGNFRTIGPGGQSKEALRGPALAKLMTDINAVSKDSPKVYIGNTAPHSLAVEYGGPNWRRSGFFVYRTVAERADEHLATAVRNIKGR